MEEFPNLIPQVGQHNSKGDSGRVLVVGGSLEYTGAPFFAAMAALRTGVDLVEIICHPMAATAIKSYSPDLIVHPVMTTSTLDSMLEGRRDRFNALLIGPGLSRSAEMQADAKKIFKAMEDYPTVIDGVHDGILMFADPEIRKVARDHMHLCLTPNRREFVRLLGYYGISCPEIYDMNDALELAKKLVTNLRQDSMVVVKGHEDLIVRATWEHVTVPIEGTPRRCGGQGDILAGCLAAFFAWHMLAFYCASPLACATGACIMVRLSGNKTYKRVGRSMVASDMLQDISVDHLLKM